MKISVSKTVKIILLSILIAVRILLSAQTQTVSGNQTIKVGVYCNPPKIFMQNNGNPDGIFIDILTAIAEKENLQIEYISGSWNDLFTKLKKGKIDILPDMAYSKERDSLFYFSTPVLNSWLQVFSTNKCVINKIGDLKNKRVGVLKTSSQEDFMKADNPVEYTIFTYQDYHSSVSALKANKIDVIVANRFFYFSDLCDKDILPTGVILQFSELHFAFSKKIHPEIIKIFNKDITLLINNPDSEYYTSLQKWLNKNKMAIPSYMWWTIIILSCGSVIFLLFIFMLNYKVKAKTEILRKKNNELATSKEKAEINELYFRSIFENSPVAKSITNIDGSMRSNDAFCQLLGYSQHEFEKKNWKEITHPDDIQKSIDIIDILLKNEQQKIQFEKRYLHKNGSVIFADVYTTLRRNDNKNPLFFITIINDITERKRIETELKKAKDAAEESDKLKTVFLQNMSHEIRTPMNGILGFLDLLKDPMLNSQSKNQYIEIINASGERLLKTINDIIEISKIESNQVLIDITAVDIRAIMDFQQNFFSGQAQRKGLTIKISRQLPHNQSVIESDSNILNGILTNLINNAIKFTAKGGIELGNYLQDNTLVFFVKDTGIGIPADRIEAIFHRFVCADLQISRPHEGSGLGLSIVKAYIEMLGGNIWVQSKIDTGSTFFFSIPYNPVSYKSANKKNTGSTTMPDKKLTILIAEDDDICFMYLERVIESKHINILRAKNGKEAVILFERYPSISLVLMDIKMPIMNGIDAAKHIRKINAAIPIIAQTAYVMSEDKKNILEAGFENIITKPINKDELIRLIKKYI